MPENVTTQHDEIVLALGKRLLAEAKDYSAEHVKTLAEAYKIAREAGYDY